MISTDITGGGNGDYGQVFTLLSVVSNPELYAEKLKALVKATEEHKKYVELVAPASEIMALRQKVEQEAEESKKVLSEAKNKAETILEEAKVSAAAKEAAAQKSLDAANGKLSETQATCAAMLSAVEAERAAAKDREQRLVNAETKLFAEQAALKSARADADKAKAEALAVKAALIAKHQAFIESL